MTAPTPFRTPLMDQANVGEDGAEDALQFRWFGMVMFFREFLTAIQKDTTMVVFAILFVFACLFAHTRSTLVACLSMWQIVMSIPFTMIIYQGVLGITYLSSIHSTATFLICGIGADDCFVFVDGFKQAKKNVLNIKKAELALRTERNPEEIEE